MNKLTKAQEHKVNLCNFFLIQYHFTTLKMQPLVKISTEMNKVKIFHFHAMVLFCINSLLMYL